MGYTKISNNDTTENGIWGKNVLAARIHNWNFGSVHMSRSGSRTLAAQDLKIANTSISKYFKHTHSICIDLVGCSNADVDRTLYFNVDSGICRIVPNLKQLTLNFTNCLRFSTWQSSEKWSSLRYLKELNIIFNRSFDLTDQSIENLDSKLKYLDQLRKLKLVFKECDRITDGGVAALGQKIKYMSRLENLILDFSGCFHLTEPCIITLMSRILSTPHRLKQLSLGLYACHQISDNALVLLGTYLNQNQTNLQSLTLNFAGCHKITDAGLELLGTELIRQLTRLRELYLDFSWCRELTDKSLQAILSEMNPESDSWQNVVFKFPGCKMTNKIKDDVRKSWASHSKFLLK